MKKTIILLSMLTFAVSCGKVCKNQSFNLSKNQPVGALRSDGFYYGDFDTSSSNEIRISLIILYNNGVLLTSGSLYDQMESSLDGLNKSEELSKKTKAMWGLFNNTASTIEIENIIPRPCGVWVENRTGNILNDTTFILTKRKVYKQKKETEHSDIDQVFRFRAYNPKPDSTNDFIQ